MPSFLIAIAIVIGGLWFIRKLGKTPKAAMPGFIQKVAGSVIIGFSGFLALRGAMNMAVPLFLFGLGILGKPYAFPNGFPWGGGRSAGQKSRVATSLLAMELDHDSGNMEGEILAGAFKGRRLSSLSQSEMQSFHTECMKAPDQSRVLLESWLDRTQPEWRGAWGGSGRASAAAGPMSREEALQVLGLKPGASADEIRAAHKRLMKDFHPDRGGSDYLASKINAAKDVLLG